MVKERAMENMAARLKAAYKTGFRDGAGLRPLATGLDKYEDSDLRLAYSHGFYAAASKRTGAASSKEEAEV